MTMGSNDPVHTKALEILAARRRTQDCLDAGVCPGCGHEKLGRNTHQGVEDIKCNSCTWSVEIPKDFLLGYIK